MKISLNGLINQVNGRIGNLVAFAGRTSNIVRQIVVPMNPQSPTQVAARAQVAYYSALWRTLLPANIISWNRAAQDQQQTDAVGSTYSMDGFNFFMALNLTARYFDPASADIVTPPSPIAPTNNGNIANLVLDSAPQTVTIDLPLVSSGDLAILEATAQTSAGVSNFKGKYRPIKYLPAGSQQLAYDATGDYTAVFGTLIAAKKISFRFRYYGTAGPTYRKFYGGAELAGKVL